MPVDAGTWEAPCQATSPSKHPDVWVVIPAFNESVRLPQVLERLSSQYENIVVVNDGSSDETLDTLKNFPQVAALHHSTNRGQGASLVTGISHALKQGAKIIVTFDADGQHSSNDIQALVLPIRAGECDVVLGSRWLGKSIGMPLSRRLMLKCALVFTRLHSGIKLSDTHNGLRALSRTAAERINLRFCGPAHASEILRQIGRLDLRYKEVPVTILYSKESLRKSQGWFGALKIAITLWRGRE